ncbi:hypothetical protein C9374_009326 [Naegleria lovaniensis]|uniref:Guanine nucleotide-binding protein subunit beta-like protein n=1 Tax=Naegleria lovaniensis TaxID=51637 RepID=A0AA88GHV6_NAELO|nr:uncharacterized protein C9374_009326 [Naegleria lovaniensis]KAG2377415.1 hypothetical protein C9374_009326 [Naegleria lovaniensis]
MQPREPSVSYLLPYPNHKIKAHRFGINKLLYLEAREGSTTTENNTTHHQEPYYLFSGGRDGTIKCWALHSSSAQHQQIHQQEHTTLSPTKTSSHSPHQFMFSLEEHVDWVSDMILLSDKRHLISCSHDNTIMLWDVDINNPQHCLTYRTHTDYVTCLAAPYTPLGGEASTCSLFCSGGLDSSVFLWDAERLVSIRKYFASLNNPTSSNMQDNSSPMKTIQQYDIQSLQSYYPPQLSPQPKHSIYALAMSTCSANPGSIIDQHVMVAAGSTDQMVRLYDFRTSTKIGKLRGHKDNIRCVLLSVDGKKCITGSTDGTVKCWDLKTQRCLQTYSFSNPKTLAPSSVWTLEFDPHDPDQNTVIVGTREGLTYQLDTKYRKSCTITNLHSINPYENRNSVLSTLIIPCKNNKANSTLWVGALDSNLYEFEYGRIVENINNTNSKDIFSQDGVTVMATTPKSASSSFSHMDFSSPVTSSNLVENPPTPKTPSSRSRASSFLVQRRAFSVNAGISHYMPRSKIPGCPGIVEHFILNCRKRVLVKDNSGRISLWDITNGKMIEDFGNSHSSNMTDDDLFEKLCADFSKEMISVRNWFTIEKKLGSLEIVLTPNECFNAENYAYESGFLDCDEEDKVNYGVMIIQALFRRWREKRNELLAARQQEESIQNIEHGTKDDETPMNDATTTKTASEHSTPEQTAQQHESSMTSEQQQQQPHSDPMNHELQRAERKFDLPENTAVIIHFEKTCSDKSPFKKQIRHFDGEETEGFPIPQWVVDITNGLPPNVNPQSHKLSFYLEPAPDEPFLKPLQLNSAKSLAHRILRIYKVAFHVVNKLNIELPTFAELEEIKRKYYEYKRKEHELNPEIPLVTRESDEAFDESLILPPNIDLNLRCRPEDLVEVFCQGHRMKNRWNLAIANAFFRPKNVSYITLHYRQRYLIPSSSVRQ